MATITLASLIVPYTPSGAKSKGDVVVANNRIGIVVRDIPANTIGELCVEGTGIFPKLTSGGSAIADGKDVYWKVSGPNISTTPSDGLYLGVTNGASVDADATQTVAFSQTGTAASIGGGGVSQATVVAALTDNSGGATADGTIGAVTTFTPSVAWNGSSVYPSAADATAIAAAITALMAAIKELSTKQNEVIAVLKTAGLMASA